MISQEHMSDASALFTLQAFLNCEKCVASKDIQGSEVEFLKAVTVWIKKPHVVNRRLCGSKLLSVLPFQCKRDVSEFLDVQRQQILSLSSTTEHSQLEDLCTEKSPYTVIARQLIPKSEHFPKVSEIIVYEKQSQRVTFIPICDGENSDNDNQSTKEIPYCLQFTSSSTSSKNVLTMSWSCDHSDPDVPKRQLLSKWLTSVLLEKLVNWSSVENISTAVTSLQLVDVDEYQKTYSYLKNKYGRDLVKNWTESTDPHKFVYEDVAIAAYLLLIWKQDRQEKNLQHKQTFVDLGCGNGLLVYILTKEGHKGLGLDLRRRKIWDTFGADIDLQERTITPSGDNLFPDYDWLIGNHSDELTPWIPVISARSSYSSCFFVIPCCHFDFVGKFTQSEKGKSKYASYLNYVKDVILHCGFTAECDTLRIPATKRVCYIGRQRIYDKDGAKQADEEMQSFIDRRCELRRRETGSGNQQSHDYVDLKVEEHQRISSSTLPSSSFTTVSSDNIVKDDRNCDLSSHPLPSNTMSDDIKNQSVSASTETIVSESSLTFSSDNDSHTSLSDTLPSCKKPRLDPESEHVSSKKVSDTQRSSGNSSKCVNAVLTVSKTEKTATDTGGVSPWVSDFQPRQEAKVRNCQRLPDDTKLKIVKAVFSLVLEADAESSVSVGKNATWRKGGSVPLATAVSLFDKATLLQLKSECGGLQTLLRNHSHIFQVTGGHIQLRDFSKADPWEGRKPQKVKDKGRPKVKTTLCWFFRHHPDGCPREATLCSFAHGDDDLRQNSNSDLNMR